MLLLAQTMDTAEKGLSLLEKINAGGVPLLALVFAVVSGLIALKFYRDKTSLETAFRDRVQELLIDQIKATGDNASTQARANQVIESFLKDATEIKKQLSYVETELKLLKEKVSHD